MPFGERLKQARLDKHMTQEELAMAVGVTKGAIGNYETEVSSPKESILIRLMQVLCVDANYLFRDLVPSFPNATLTREEEEMLTAWRSATDDARRFALQMLRSNPSSTEESPRHA